MQFNFDVALSFAGEDRQVVEPIAAALREKGLSIFYDAYEEANLWGKDLYQHLDQIYRHEARFCIIFASAAYAVKVWTRHELKSAQARAIEESEEYILPVRIDDTPIPGIRPTTAYLVIKDRSPQEIADLVAKKITAHTSPPASQSVVAPVAPANDFSAITRELETLRAAAAGRALSASSRAALIASLCSLAPQRMGIFSPEADEEAAEYGEAIATAFQEAGWPTVHRASMYASTILGVQVVALTGVGYPEGPIPESAHEIAAALEAGGIVAEVIALRELPTEFRTFIAVGKKRRRDASVK